MYVCMYVRMYVRMYLRVITNGHKNEKGENYCTIWLKLYTYFATRREVLIHNTIPFICTFKCPFKCPYVCPCNHKWSLNFLLWICSQKIFIKDFQPNHGLLGEGEWH